MFIILHSYILAVNIFSSYTSTRKQMHWCAVNPLTQTSKRKINACHISFNTSTGKYINAKEIVHFAHQQLSTVQKLLQDFRTPTLFQKETLSKMKSIMESYLLQEIIQHNCNTQTCTQILLPLKQNKH